MIRLALLTAFLAVLLGADHFVGRSGQVALAVAAFAVLFAACRSLTPERRAQVAVVVCVATCFEVLGSIVWGVYRYRLGNLPPFVPPAHGLVYLTGLQVSRLELVRRHERAFMRLILALGLGWAAIGLSGVLGRVDAIGAFGVLVFSAYLCLGPAPSVYGGVFLAVAGLELYGTAIGTWRWAAVVPGLGLPDGNPPAGAASGYVLFDIAAMALAPFLVAAFRRRHAPAPAPQLVD
jgi:hypothetical protein